MSPLDLPPELFEKVVHQLVLVAGINGAWKLRGVCRTFKTAITYDVFAKQPVKAFTHAEERIFDHNSGLYLYYRSKLLLDPHPYLPKTINDMVNYLAKQQDINTDNEKEALRQTLCDTLCRTPFSYEVLSSLRYGDPYGETYSKALCFRPFGISEKLVAALYFGYDHLVLALMKKLPSLDSHPVFGAPLKLAIKLGHEATIRAILRGISEILKNKSCAQSIQDAIPFNYIPYGFSYSKSGFNIGNAINIAINHDNVCLINLFATWCKGEGHALSKNIYNGFMQTAIHWSSLATVQAVLKIPYTTSGKPKKVTWADYRTACRFNRSDVVRLFLKHRYINANDTVQITSPLLEAVFTGSFNIVKIIVKAGADVNKYHAHWRRMVKPIEYAIRKHNCKIIQCLLDAGAHLPPVTSWPIGKNRGEIYEILRKAAIKRGDGYNLPVFARFRKMSKEERNKL